MPPQTTPAQEVEVAEPTVLLAYVKKVVLALLEDVTGSTSGETVGLGVAALESCFRDPKTVDAVRKFIVDPQCAVLLVERAAASRGTLFTVDEF